MTTPNWREEFDKDPNLGGGFKDLSIILQRYETKEKADAACKKHSDHIKAFFEKTLTTLAARIEERRENGGGKICRYHANNSIAKSLCEECGRKTIFNSGLDTAKQEVLSLLKPPGV